MLATNHHGNSPDLRRVGIGRNFWYPLARSRQLKKGKTLAVAFAGEPIVLVPTEGWSKLPAEALALAMTLSAVVVGVQERDPEAVWERLPRVAQLDPRSRAVARALAAWRERTAVREDRPVGSILADQVLVEVARRRPPTRDELARLRGLYAIVDGPLARPPLELVRAFLRGGAAVVQLRPKTVAARERLRDASLPFISVLLHPTTGGDNYLDISSLTFHIPLAALLPRRVENLLPACKNLGVTHITNGCYRLHPVEWNIGESAGYLAAFALETKESPQAIRNTAKQLAAFQTRIRREGVETAWPKLATPSATNLAPSVSP